MKNILILGSRLTGKTTLANKLNEECGFSIVRLDDIIKTLDSVEGITPKMKEEYIINYLDKINSDVYFYCERSCVVEGNLTDINTLVNINYENYDVIPLIYENINDVELLKQIRANSDTTSWTYYLKDDMLLSDIQSYLEQNIDLICAYKELKFKQYDVSYNRNQVFNEIIAEIKDDRKLIYKH